MVVKVGAESGGVELSLRRAGAGLRLTAEQLSVGDIVAGTVRAVEKYGLFVRIDNCSCDGLIHKTQVSDTASVSLDSYKPGARIARARVLTLEAGKVGLGIKPSLFDEAELEDEEPEEEEPGQAQGAGAAAARPHSAAGGTGPAAASDEEAPWSSAAASAGLDPAASAAFEWPELQLAAEPESDAGEAEAVAEAEVEDGQQRPSKRRKKAMKLAEAQELQRREAEGAVAGRAVDPRSVEDFERLLLSKGDTSIIWIRYMAFHLKLSDLERARQVAERAVKHVGFSDAKERFNAWVAYMNLECTFGTEEAAEAVFQRAASHNPAKHVHLQLARIHERNQKPQLAGRAHEACCRKFPHSKKAWLALLAFLYRRGDLEAGRGTLPRCLAALPRRKHPLVVSQAALLEYRHGSAERGRSVFEGLLDSYPKRTDLWSVYIDAHLAAHTPPRLAAADLPAVRGLLERCCGLRLKPAKMRFFFKRWLDFEKRWGDAESQELVRARAREFVEEQA
mmetsp:Transcript_70225/g.227362  ORF Transcript_70225/g.227362 Transcript_70225/m.227362 type:complete len:507 (-) Transcript_70225:92-1612(-)